MLSFHHPNVMSLIGVCLDGEMPLLIMPFMSNGNVLKYIKDHKQELLLCSKAEEKEARHIFLSVVYVYASHDHIIHNRYKPLRSLFWVCVIKLTREWLI